MRQDYGLWELAHKAKVITLIGAGGKTTSLLRLAEEISSQGYDVIQTTTTKVYPVKAKELWINPATPPPPSVQHPCFWYVQTEEKTGKWIGPKVETVDQALEVEKNNNIERFWIIEGDGARGLQLKCWAEHEPQIPASTECAVLLLRGDLWGKTLDDKVVHRAEYCLDLTGQTWNAQTCWEYLRRSPVYYPEFQHIFWVVLFNELSENPAKTVKDIAIKDILKEIKDSASNAGNGPRHLRIAAGNVKEGTFRWLDLS